MLTRIAKSMGLFLYMGMGATVGSLVYVKTYESLTGKCFYKN